MTKVGVNKYTEGVDMEVKLHEYNEEWGQLKIERLQNFKNTRDNKSVKESLKSYRKCLRYKDRGLTHYA